MGWSPRPRSGRSVPQCARVCSTERLSSLPSPRLSAAASGPARQSRKRAGSTGDCASRARARASLYEGVAESGLSRLSSVFEGHAKRAWRGVNHRSSLPLRRWGGAAFNPRRQASTFFECPGFFHIVHSEPVREAVDGRDGRDGRGRREGSPVNALACARVSIVSEECLATLVSRRRGFRSATWT